MNVSKFKNEGILQIINNLTVIYFVLSSYKKADSDIELI